MATTKQKNVAKEIVENAGREKPKTDKEILKCSNYSQSVVDTKSTKIINSEGVQQELQVLGFTSKNAKTVVSEILLNSDARHNDRLKAADMVFKVDGTYAPEKKAILTQKVESNAKTKELTDRFEEEFKQTLLHDH